MRRDRRKGGERQLRRFVQGKRGRGSAAAKSLSGWFLAKMKRPIYLYVVPFFPSQSSWRGGFFLDAAKSLVRDGRFDVRVMVCSGGSDYEIDGIRVYSFGRFSFGCSDYLNFVTDAVKLHQFRKKLSDVGVSCADVAVCHVHLLSRMAIYATWMKRRNPESVTLIHHHLTGEGGLGYSRMPWLPFVKAIQYLRLRRDFECADLHVFCSRQTKAAYSKVCKDGNLAQMVPLRTQLAFSRLYRDFRLPRSFVLYNGYDSRLFREDGERKRSGAWRIGCVANFLEAKSQITLIKAFLRVRAQMPDAELVFVGSGRTLQSCIACSRSGGEDSHIVFLQEMDHSDIPDFYRSLDLYVLPSYYREAFNCSLVEAWACGVPCLATSCISFKEVLPEAEREKWLFPERDDVRLAERLLWAYHNRPRRQKLDRDLDIDAEMTRFLDFLQETYPRLQTPVRK